MLKTLEGAFIRRSRRSLCFLSPALKIKCKDLFMPRKLLVGKATLKTQKLSVGGLDTSRYPPTDSFWVFRVAVGSHQKEIGINAEFFKFFPKGVFLSKKVCL